MCNRVHKMEGNAMVSKVREIRKEKQMTQDYLASVSGISRKYLSLIETNKATPSVDIAVRLSLIHI